jgi:23S rRNA (adenine2503-C2)-methyltransferase
MSMDQEPTPRRSALDLTYPELENELVAAGVRAFHARKLWSALHRESQVDPCQREDFPPPLARWVAKNLAPSAPLAPVRPSVADDIPSSDGLTRKFLLRLSGGQTIETVLMRYPGRYTACLSTQAGCAMGCVFCATGQMGFVRHLQPGEIVAQVLHTQETLRAAGQPGLRNLVLMGMGEPLHNYDSVMRALEIISDTRGLNIGPSKISISTVGVIPGILRMAEEKRPYNLAVSLHSASEEERAALVPASRRWPLKDLIAACRVYGEKTGQRILFGWTLIEGKNDSPTDAENVAKLLRGIDAHVNLIPLNPTDGYPGAPSAHRAADEFQRVLQEAGIPSTIRQRRGIDVAAGCGQLKAARSGARRPEPTA